MKNLRETLLESLENDNDIEIPEYIENDIISAKKRGNSLIYYDTFINTLYYLNDKNNVIGVKTKNGIRGLKKYLSDNNIDYITGWKLHAGRYTGDLF